MRAWLREQSPAGGRAPQAEGTSEQRLPAAPGVVCEAQSGPVCWSCIRSGPVGCLGSGCTGEGCEQVLVPSVAAVLRGHTARSSCGGSGSCRSMLLVAGTGWQPERDQLRGSVCHKRTSVGSLLTGVSLLSPALPGPCSVALGRFLLL